MRRSLAQWRQALTTAFGEGGASEDNCALTAGFVLLEGLNELTLEVPLAQLHPTLQRLRDDATLSFDALVDVAGVDYQEYHGRSADAPRFAVVYHLLSTAFNGRLRVRAWISDAMEPAAPSVVDLWPSANWMERECFDMFGITFDGHPDLRRILTDYGFSGHPFRKDFPLSGHLEMRYDPEKKRVIYEPLTIEARNNVPRVVREDHYGDNTPMPLPPAAPVVPPVPPVVKG